VPSSCALLVDLQSVHGFRCYDNTDVCKLIALYTANAYSAEREMSASACTRFVAGSDIGGGLGLILCTLHMLDVSACLCFLFVALYKSDYK